MVFKWKKFQSFLLLLLACGILVNVLARPEVAISEELLQRANAKPAIVLVHGAFADGSSWQHVIPLLEQEGYKVTAMQVPLSSLADDVAMTFPRLLTMWQ